MQPYRLSPNEYDYISLRRMLSKLFTPLTLRLFCYDHFPAVYQNLHPDMPVSMMVQQLIRYCQQAQKTTTLLPIVRDDNPHLFLEYDPAFRQFAQSYQHLEKRQFFFSYKPQVNPDRTLVSYVQNVLDKLGHAVYVPKYQLDQQTHLSKIDQKLREADYLLLFLSEQSADSEMIRAEIERANQYWKAQSWPRIWLIRVVYNGLLPYSIDTLLDNPQEFSWQAPYDHEPLVTDLLHTIEQQQGFVREAALTEGEELTRPSPPKRLRQLTEEHQISDDGQLVSNRNSLHPPMPEFDPRFLYIPSREIDPQQLYAPGGAVKLQDRFYIQRAGDLLLQRQLAHKSGTTTTIRAARQMGKSSLLVRGINQAQQQGAVIIYLDLQGIDQHARQSHDHFLRYLGEFMIRKLRLDLRVLEVAWQESLGPKDKLTYLMEDYILPAVKQNIVLALDEVDLLLQPQEGFHTEFFSLLRSWHNSRAYDFSGQWDKLYIIMAISTEPYLLIQDVNQSPFNVGPKIYLQDFDRTQVFELNWRHGGPVKGRQFDKFMALLNGHPYLTRKALFTMATQDLSWSQFATLVKQDTGPFGDHLLRNYWLLTQDVYGLSNALLQIIEHQQCSDEIAVFRLLKAGLIKGSGDRYTCRCDLYKRYFWDKLT